MALHQARRVMAMIGVMLVLVVSGRCDHDAKRGHDLGEELLQDCDQNAFHHMCTRHQR
jgi:hypothetical protein